MHARKVFAGLPKNQKEELRINSSIGSTQAHIIVLKINIFCSSGSQISCGVLSGPSAS